MSSDHWVAVFSALISFTGLLLVAIQMRRSTKQRGMESLVTVYDINRQLLSLGFSHPKLFAIMNDAKDTDPVWERYYLQMWLNQLALIHAYLHDAVLGGELRESLEREIAEFVTRDNVRRHWQQHGTFFPASFQKLVSGIIERAEPPVAARVASGI